MASPKANSTLKKQIPLDKRVLIMLYFNLSEFCFKKTVCDAWLYSSNFIVLERAL